MDLVPFGHGADADAGLDVTIDAGADGTSWSWTVTNPNPNRVACRSVWQRFRVDADGAASMFVNGWQSWSPTGWRTAGVDTDPSTAGPHPSLLRWCHHADPDVAQRGELRSELVTALSGAKGAVVLGALGGAEHDTTFRLLDGTLTVQAWLGGAELGPGESRKLHPVAGFADLDAWAAACGRAAAARASAPFTTGWCSWYQYFADVTERDIRLNLEASTDGWGFDVFQIDDGFQAAIGDWLETDKERFPTSLEAIAADIRAAGSTPGLWLAPFLAAPESEVARRRPDWFAHHRGSSTERPLVGQVNAAWGGEVWVLDTTLPEVQAHLEALGRSVVAAGFPYLKLDFTYAPALPGVYADPALTPAQRVRVGYDAIRRGAGDRAFILGCGAPLGAVIGAVDGCRIGPDVAPWWDGRDWPIDGEGYRPTAPSVGNALASTVARDAFHRRLWLNDPDCLLLRPTDTALTAAERQAWAGAVALTGGMVLLSDDLGRLGRAERDVWARTVAMARQADARARAGLRFT